MRFLNNKETKKFVEQLENQFKTKVKLDHYVCSKENKFYIISKDLAKINIEELNIKSIGLFIGKQEQDKFVPSKEASQMFDF